MEELGELMSVCRAADTDKLSDRRKSQDKLLKLLASKYIWKALDKCTQKKAENSKERLFGWDDLFRVAKNNVWKEMEAVQKAKDPSSVAVQKKKREAMDLLQTVTKKAHRKGCPMLKGAAVVSHIIEVMKSESASKQLGSDHTYLLLKEILNKRKYICDLDQDMWQELLHIYLNLLKNQKCGFDRVLLAQTIHAIIAGASEQCDIKGRKLLPILQEFFNTIKEEKVTSVVENILRTTNLLCGNMSMNCRVQICHLGEHIFVPLIYIWRHRHNDVLKEEIIQFFQLQMCAHHPRGARTESEGAFAHNWTSWKSCLKTLYETIYSDIVEHKSRNKFSSNVRSVSQYELKPTFIQLTVDLCTQLFNDESSLCEVTQISFLESQQGQGNAAKKRRIQSGWEMILDNMISAGPTTFLIPWLQLLTSFFQHNPQSIPQDVLVQYLVQLQSLHGQAKKIEVSRWLQRCLQALVSCQMALKHSESHSTLLELCQPIWTKVWNTTLRTISLHHAEDVGFLLLESLVQTKTVVADNDVWMLFNPNICTVSSPAVSFLCSLLENVTLPEKYCPDKFADMERTQNYPLRHQLVQWLLPLQEEQEENMNKAGPSVTDLGQLARVLVTLSVRDTQLVTHKHSQPSVNTPKRFQDTEDCYLHTSFHLSVKTMTECHPLNEGEALSVSCVSEIKEFVLKQVQRDCHQQLNATDLNTKSMDIIAEKCVFLVKFLQNIISIWHYSLVEMSKMDIFESLKMMMKRLGDAMKETLKRSGPVSVSHTVHVIRHIFDMSSFPTLSAPEKQQLARLSRLVFHHQLVEQLLDIVAEKSQQNGSKRSSSRIDASLFDEDDGLETTRSDVSALYMDDEDDDDEFTMESSLSSDLGSGVPSPLFPGTLSEKDGVRIAVANLLCCLCHHDHEESNMEDIGPTVSTLSIINPLLDTLEEKPLIWDAHKPYHLQLTQCLIEGLAHQSRVLDDEEIETLLDSVRAVCKAQRRDQGVCVGMLRLISLLVYHLAAEGDTVSPSKQDSRTISVQLFGVFWRLALKDQYVNSTRVIIAECMLQYIKADPNAVWTCWKAKDKNSNSGSVQEKICVEYPRLLIDKHQPIRLLASEGIKTLFCLQSNGKVTEYSRNHQNDMFDRIYTLLQQNMDVQDHKSADEKRDELTNRTSSMLHALMSIACISPVCEKKAVFAKCQMFKEYNIDHTLVIKVLNQISDKLGYPSVSSYMTEHIPYLVDLWLSNDYKLSQFPVALCEYKSLQDFYRDHVKVIVPSIIMRKNLEDVQAVARALGEDWRELVKTCIPKILIHILPLFAANKNEELSGTKDLTRRVSQATACYDLLNKVVSQVDIEQSIVTNMTTLVVDILMTFHSPGPTGTDADRYVRDSDPEPNPPFYDASMIICTLDYLSKGHGSRVSSLVEVLAKTQDGIQVILLSLATRLDQSLTVHGKCRVMLMFHLFVKLLLKEFHTQIGGCWAFALRAIIYTLLHTIKASKITARSSTKESDLVLMCCDLLHQVCSVAAESCVQELGRFLSVITNVLAPHVGDSGDVGHQCSRIIELLLVESSGSLRSSIALLDPLPDTPAFKGASAIFNKYKYALGKFTLAQEIEHFLKAREHSEGSCCPRPEGLIFLHQQLHSRKKELVKLAFGHEAEYRSNLLPQLVRELLLLGQSQSEAVSQEAGRCLGELGPLELPVIALSGLPLSGRLATVLNCYQGNTKMQNYCKIFLKLDEYLLDSNIDTVIAASKVLKEVLATKPGMAFYMDYKEKVQDHLFQYLHPFKPSKKKPSTSVGKKHLVDNFVEAINDDLLWCPSHNDHQHWIQVLTVKLIESGALSDDVLKLLTPACNVKASFCEMVIPFLVHDILMQGVDIFHQILSQQITKFFEKHCGLFKKSNSRPNTPFAINGSVSDESLKTVCTNKDSVQTMLSIVQYLRCQQKPAQGRRESNAWDNNFWLDLDFLQMSKAAQNCSAYFTTVMYSEIWCDIQRITGSVHVSGGTSQSCSQSSLPGEVAQGHGSQLEALSAIPNPANINVQDLMLEAYRSIGDPDAVYGCGAGRLADTTARIHTYEHENNWSKALASYDIEASQQPHISSQLGLLQALQNFGSSHILDAYLQGIQPVQSAEMKEFQYQVAWRSCKWHMDIPTRHDENYDYNQALFSGLCYLKDQDQIALSSSIEFARKKCLESLSRMSMESIRSYFPVLSRLHSVNLLEKLAAQWFSNNKNIDGIIKHWATENSLLQNDFDFIEPVLSLRCVLCQVLTDCSSPSTAVYQALISQLQLLCQRGREASRYQVSERATSRLQRLENVVEDKCGASAFLPWHVEESMTFWARDEKNIAKHIMKVLLKNLEQPKTESESTARLYAKCLGLYGTWLADTRSESPNVVLEKYLSKSVDLLEELGKESDEALDAYLSLARYTDTQYQNIVNYMNSSIYEAKQALIGKAKEDAILLKEMGDKTSRYVRILERQTNIDVHELAVQDEDKTRFLLCAIENYLKCLECGSAHDLRVFRLTSLWFDNTNSVQVNKLMQRSLDKIMSYKFLPLMYQLAARMSASPKHGQDLFQPTLDWLIQRTITEHPHHTLFIVLALAHANKDLEWTQTNKRGKKSSLEDTPEEDRVVAAKAMIEKLKNSERSDIIFSMEKLCNAFIQLAYYDVEKYKKETTPIALPSALLLTKLGPLPTVAMPTLEVAVDPSCSYKDIVYVAGFHNKFQLAGGINLPKIISCVGSDGVRRRQLVKGKDDLRQDAVMQQFFGMVNSLLEKNQETRQRHLRLRTYKVIPLSQRSGLLEWCEGTIPLGDYLIKEGSGAHIRYRPNDCKAIDCRKAMNEAHASQSLKKKFETFMTVCKRFQPVFRYFFLEKFPTPADWYERRLAYTTSVATNSIVGYILGLGDRHVQNILIDCATAELVNIDLGVAFEQGKILPTPETVPFRLSRDVVDGMGVAGVEGVFRRSCEKTMEVMHQSHEALLTILQVFLYDPLYAWMMSPHSAMRLQARRGELDTSDANTTSGDLLSVVENKSTKVSQENLNKVAERVLLRLQQKLQGVEDGVQLSVSGQVNHLIQEARDPKNLCRLFPGWQAYI